MILDTSGLLVALRADEPLYEAAASLIEASPRPPLISPFILTEADYFLAKWGNWEARLQMLRDVANGAIQLEPMSPADVAAATDIVERYADLGVSLADASICVLAERTGIADLLTLDERHFRVLPGPGGRPFRILPADLLAGR